jgi:hypothetical protein
VLLDLSRLRIAVHHAGMAWALDGKTEPNTAYLPLRADVLATLRHSVNAIGNWLRDDDSCTTTTLMRRRRGENKAWKVPKGFVRVGDFAAHNSIPRSTISRWEKVDEPERATDPQSNEVCLPEKWLNERLNRYKRRPRPRR